MGETAPELDPASHAAWPFYVLPAIAFLVFSVCVFCFVFKNEQALIISGLFSNFLF